MLHDEFTAAAPGSLVRQRILDIIFRATKHVDDKRGPRDDLGALSDEDLERELEVAIGEATPQ